MIGTSVHPRRPRDHLDAVHVGQAEVEDDHVGWLCGRRSRAPRRPWPRHGPRSARARRLMPSARRIWGSSSTTSTRVISADPSRSRRSRWPGSTAGARSGDGAAGTPPSSARRRGSPRGRACPPIASVRPRDRASPSPTPAGVVGVARAAGTAAKIRVPVRLGGMPGPRSMTRSSTRSPSALPVSVRRPLGGRVAQRVRDEVGQRPARAGPGRPARRAARRARRPGPAVPSSPEVVERPGDDLVDGRRLRASIDRRPACSRLMSSRLSTRRGQPVEGRVRGCEQLVAGPPAPRSTSGLRRLVTRRPWPRPAGCAGRGRPRRAARCASGWPRRAGAACGRLR